MSYYSSTMGTYIQKETWWILCERDDGRKTQ